MNGLTASGLTLSLLVSLFLTLALEGSFALAMGVRKRGDFILVCLVNLLTNPPVVLLSHLLRAFLPTLPMAIPILLLEFSAVFIEGWCYNRFGRAFRRPYLFSLAANTVSYCLGALLNTFI